MIEALKSFFKVIKSEKKIKAKLTLTETKYYELKEEHHRNIVKERNKELRSIKNELQK